ncbi:hypothetical protein KUTeg_000100 [Tegillarca granosa]|uniref:Uncharacterized protein n=1 Tax=Tegillarca granosa TaxID=220873 RepID=A0ABQ9FWP3_TEGGR|nr:hypothetical protein KUTeg_000100 [Tegillarca granosa]
MSSFRVFNDGKMVNFLTLNQSAVDPVLFSLYAFADKIFSKFSANQKINGINPEGDWPEKCPKGTGRYDQLFPGISNIDARRNYYTNCVYQYSDIPEPCSSHGECGSKFYKCSDKNVCISKRWQDFPGFSGLDVCDSKLVPPSIQTGYWIDGDADFRYWGFIPIEVNYEFPPEKVLYNNFPVRNNKFDTKYDIYNVPGIERYQSTDAARHQKCAEPPTINIESNGLNYAGLYKDFGLPDTRVAMSQTIVYVAVKKPTAGRDSEFLLSGYDTCGRICKPVL